MTYAVIILRRAQKELSALPEDAYVRIRETIRELNENAAPCRNGFALGKRLGVNMDRMLRMQAAYDATRMCRNATAIKV